MSLRALPRSTITAALALVVLAGGLGATPDAEARRRRKNMPADWTWPPSKAMRADGDRCLARLDELGVRYERVKKRRRKVATPILVPSMEIGGLRLEPAHAKVKRPWLMDCHLAEALADGGAAALRAEGIAVLRFIGLYDYRNVRLKKRTLKVLSRHALGLAIDVRSFVDDAGVEHEVTVKGYRRTDPLLRTLDESIAATGLFRTPLTPGNDPRSHYDHFHLEARTGREREKARAQARAVAPLPAATPASPL